MRDIYEQYSIKYKNLILDLLNYFNLSDTSSKVEERSVKEFVVKYRRDHNEGWTDAIEPSIVDRICKKLCTEGFLECINGLDGLGLNNQYMSLYDNIISRFNNEDEALNILNSIVYGFNYIYRENKINVLPLLAISKDDKLTLGTCFKYANGIVTARHCIEDVKSISIKQYCADYLRRSRVYVSQNKNLDLAFIELDTDQCSLLIGDRGEVVQDVLVMGYPKIPSFDNFLTAEKATISSIANVDVKPSKGSIAAYGNQYLNHVEAMLITAKIRGGNSGGPVIGSNGCLVGVACQEPYYDDEIGEYDDLGYGIAIPVSYLNELINTKPAKLPIKKGFFNDYPE